MDIFDWKKWVYERKVFDEKNGQLKSHQLWKGYDFDSKKWSDWGWALP